MSSITGGGGDQGQSRMPSDYTSVSATVGAGSDGRSQATNADSDPSSLNAVLPTAPEPLPVSSDPGSEFRSVNAIAGGDD